MNATPENHSMALQPRSESEGICMTEAEYLASEPNSEVRREYIDGRAYAMAGETVNHNTLSANILRKFGNHLDGTPCAIFMGGIKVSLQKNYASSDYLRGRCMKTDITVRKNGQLTLSTRNRGKAALRRLDRLQGKKMLTLI